MVFSSTVFLFLFLPAVIAVYFLIPKKLRKERNFVLLVFSLGFYFYGEPKAILVMLASILGNYLFALALDSSRGVKSKGSRTAVVAASAVFNLAIIGYFKYTGFFVENLNLLTGGALTIPQIVMPIGISFFTFQGMSYVFDVARGEVPAQRNILYVATYIAFFPQLVAGPIVRYSTIADELITRNENAEEISAGIRRFIVGLAKKLVVANSVGALADEIFALPSASLSTGEAWLGAAAFSLQILFDFSGYSDMAIGLGHVFGFGFNENFNYPYTAKSVTDFWRRWHISLSTWFRDYVYIPLGGNRRGLTRQLFNILIVWMLTGLWHGAAWNFVLWGLYFAVLLITEKLFLGKLLDKLPKFIGHLYALLAVIVGWVIFNSSDFSSAFTWLAAMFTPTTGAAGAGSHALFLLFEYKAEFAISLLLCVPAAKALSDRFGSFPAYKFIRDALTCGLFMLCIARVISSTFNPFIYFRF
jgi:Predicted membrane protein involved in D-alanine export